MSTKSFEEFLEEYSADLEELLDLDLVHQEQDIDKLFDKIDDDLKQIYDEYVDCQNSWRI